MLVTAPIVRAATCVKSGRPRPAAEACGAGSGSTGATGTDAGAAGGSARSWIRPDATRPAKKAVTIARTGIARRLSMAVPWSFDGHAARLGHPRLRQRDRQHAFAQFGGDGRAVDALRKGERA